MQDRWSKWLLEARFGGDSRATEAGMKQLAAVRDRVLDGARIKSGDTLLDVGAGDGLIAFGALERVGDDGHVIFSDISQALLDHSERIATEMGVRDHLTFVRASADDLASIGDASVDVVTTRSVLIYVKDKATAFREFHRVLKPGGRLSIFEPINSFRERHRPGRFWSGRDAAGAGDLVDRLRQHYRALQPDDDPMLDFDEHDLLGLCEDAGFRFLRLEFDVYVSPSPPATWNAATRAAGNPNIPSLGEAMDAIFSPDERARFEAHIRPIVEAGGRVDHNAVAYLQATKDRNVGQERGDA